VGKKKLVIILVIVVLLLSGGAVAYMLLSKKDSSSTTEPKPATKAEYTDQTAKNLDQGTCTENEKSELEALYQKKLDEDDPLTAARVRLDQYACAVFNNNNTEALTLLDDAKKIYEQYNQPASLDQVNTSIDFINQRIEREKNPIQESTEDKEGGT
jgi:hypothetical protein